MSSSWLCVVVLISGAAWASPWTSDQALRADQPGTPSLRVFSVGVAAGGDYWARVQRSDEVHELLHLDASGALLARARVSERLNAYGPRRIDNISLMPLQDGQLYGINSVSFLSETELTRYGADGLVRWSTVDRPLDNWCPGIAATPASALWLLCEFSEGQFQLLRTDAVGRTREVLGPATLGEGRLRSGLGVAANGAVHVAGRDASGDEMLWRFAADAALQWQQPIGAAEGASVGAMAIGGNGDVAVLLTLINGIQLQIRSPSDGALMLQRSVDLVLPIIQAKHLQAAREGGWILALATADGDVIARLSANAELLWVEPLPAGRRLTGTRPRGPALLESETGQIRLVAYRDDAQSGELMYEYFAFDLQGQLQVQVDVGPLSEVYDAVPRPQQGDFLTTGIGLGRIDEDGQLQVIDLSGAMSAREQPLLLAAYSEGEQRIVVVEQREARLLQSWRRDGQLRWQQSLPRALLQSDPLFADLQVNASSICTQITESGSASLLPVICFDRDNGVEQLRFDPSPDFSGSPQHRLLADAEIARIVRSADTTELSFTSLLDGSASRPSVALESRFAQPRSQPGAVGIAISDNGRTKVVWTDGLTPESMDISRSVSEQVFVLPQGFLRDTDWYPRGGGAPVSLDVDENAFGLQLAAGEQIQVVIRPQGGSVMLWGLDTVSGTVLWTTSLRSNSNNERVFATPDPTVVLLTGSNAADLDLRWISRADGSVVEARSLPCGASECSFERGGQIVGPQGLDLLELRRQGDTAGALRALHLAQTPALIPIDQAGVGGLWYQPGLAGQGLVLTYVPGSRTLFAPWFNYQSHPRLHDQSTLRWYSVQGVVAPDSTVAELRFLRNSGGRFAEPPATQAEDIGTARVRFESCDQGTLEYDLGLTAEGAGALPLVRLGPRTRPCQLADGSVQPATLQAPDNGGFSIRQSGAWFDPVMSGQGLMVEVVPASASQNGLLFAAWFSYDLADNNDDEFAQDWFILQGDLAAVVDGRVTVPILRAIGGNFERSQTSNFFVVGEAELQFNDCNGLQLSYRFDDNELAQAHAGLQGQQALVRIGGCQGTAVTN